MHVAQTAQVVRAALLAGARALTEEHPSTAATTVWSLRHEVARLLGEDALDTALTELQSRLLTLARTDIRRLALLASTVLAQIDQQSGTEEGYAVAAGRGEVNIVRGGGRSGRTMQLGLHSVDSTDVAVRTEAALAQPRSPAYTAAVISLVQSLLADHQRELGSEHPATLITLTNLAHLYRSAGRAAEAIQALEQVATQRRRTLGPHHPDTLSVEAALTQWQAERGPSSSG